jgi:hypothetical protein
MVDLLAHTKVWAELSLSIPKIEAYGARPKK